MSPPRILLVLAAAGNAPQEALKSADTFERNGARVQFAALDGGAVRFDPVCRLLAYAECARDRTLRLMRAATRRGTFADLPSLRRLRAAGTFAAFLEQFDALVVGGGHGATYAALARDPLAHDVLEAFRRRGAVIGLICHAPALGALGVAPRVPLIRGRRVTCWPRSLERLLGALPLVGPYFMPFGRPVAELLEDAGAEVDDALFHSRARVVVDGTLVTARGPWSADAFAVEVLRLVSPASVAARR